MVVDADCGSAADAESLEGGVRALLALARMAVRNQPATGALLESLALMRKEKQVKLTADLAPELLDQFLREMSAGSQR